MKEKIRKRKKVIITILVVCALIAVAGITYAFITQVLTGEKQVVINAGVLDLVLEEENAITISDALPMYDEVGMVQDDVFKFRLVNKTANDTNYILKLQEIEIGTLDKSIVKYGLVKEGEKTIDFVSNIVDGVIDEGKIAGSDTIDYELRLWIDSSVTEITQVKSKFLSFKLSARVSQDIMFVKALDDIVIDFGLPVEIKQPKLDEGRIVEELSYATYGKVEIEGDSSKEDFTIRYIPTEILRGIDNVHLVTEDNKEYTFNVYPATTVYYEEEFINNDGWTMLGNRDTTTQSYNVLGNSSDLYGYDKSYSNNIGPSSNTQVTTTDMKYTGTFKFTGTGFEVFANCIPKTGYISIRLKGSAGTTKNYLADPTLSDVNIGETANEEKTHYSRSVLNVKNLTYDTYTASIRITPDVYIDGIKIYGTIENQSVYANDFESNPTFHEIRNMVSTSIVTKYGVDESTQYGSLNEMASQVYDDLTSSEKQNAVVLTDSLYINDISTGEASMTDEEKAQYLLDNGPAGELYLRKGQTVVFNVTTDGAMQIGLSVPTESTNYTIKVNEEVIGKENTELKTSVDMFYSLKNEVGTEKDYTVTITNTGNNILSVKDLKICNDSDAKFNFLTETDIEYALTAMGYNF